MKPTVSIIGVGKVGTALAILLERADYRVVAIGVRNLETSRASEIPGLAPGVLVAPVAAARLADLVFLTVPDAEIRGLAGSLVESKALSETSTLVHCSGALTSEVLRTVGSEVGYRVASFHPLQTFPSVEAALSSLPGSHCFIEGDPEAIALLETLGTAIGVKCVRIETGAKVLYHAAAVMACNYLCSLMDAARRLHEAAGIEQQQVWPALEPLVRATLDNILAQGPGAALTGPIARGDHATVAAHLTAIDRDCDEIGPVYRALGSWTVELAGRNGALDAEQMREFALLLESRPEARPAKK